MKHAYRWPGFVLLTLLSLGGTAARSAELTYPEALAKVRAVGPRGEGHREAAAALKVLNQGDINQLPTILTAIDGTELLAANWLRSVAETVAQNHLAKGGKLPVALLEKHLQDTGHDPRGRRLAYELIAQVDPQAESRLIPGLIDDPSLELRRDAVALALASAEKTLAAGDKAAATIAFSRAFRSARDPDQVKTAVAKVRELGGTVDLPSHFGFLMAWKVIGPFDNVGGKGFDVTYPPEREINAQAEYDGQKGKVRWTDVSTTDDYGAIDLNKLLEKHKGAIIYAVAEFQSGADRDANFRLTSPNANKIWLNGELLTANQVYHSGTAFDQYITKGKLKKGRNVILLKIAQNEQTEPWAQEWKFQLRVCDAIGTAILSQDRKAGL